MTYYNAPNSVRSYNLFKGIGTLVLVAIVVSLLVVVNFSRPAQQKPAETSTTTPATVTTEVPKTVEEPASTPMPVPTETPIKSEPPTLAQPEIGEDGFVTLGGTGTPGSMVELWANDKYLANAQIGDDGTWSFETTFDPGKYEIAVRAVDAGGALLAESAAVTVASPAVEPPTLAQPAAGDDGEIAFHGTGVPGSTVEVWANDERLETIAVGDDGTWAFTVTFEPGEYAISVRAVDAGGALLAESVPATVSVEAVTAAPVFISPVPGDEMTGDTIELKGTGQPGTKVEILDMGKVLGTATVQDDGSWSYTYGDVEPGTHELAVRNAGEDTRTGDALSIDVVAPPPATTEPPPEAAAFAAMDIDCGVEEAPEGIDLGTTYIVAPCEFMGLIAARAGVTLAALIEANPEIEDPALIFPGQIINLPPR